MYAMAHFVSRLTYTARAMNDNYDTTRGVEVLRDHALDWWRVLFRVFYFFGRSPKPSTFSRLQKAFHTAVCLHKRAWGSKRG